MARPQVVDGGTASNMEGSCEYIEYTVAESRQGASPPKPYKRLGPCHHGLQYGGQ